MSRPPEYVVTITSRSPEVHLNPWLLKEIEGSAKCPGGFFYSHPHLDSNSSFVSSCNGRGINFEWLKGFELIMSNCN